MKISATLIRYNVMIRVTFGDSTRRHFSTGVKISDKKEFKNGVVVGRKDSAELNAIVGEKIAEIKRTIEGLSAQGIAITPENLSEALRGDRNTGDFLEFMKKRIEERPLAENTRKNHLIALTALKRFGRIRGFSSVTTENIMLFDRFIKEEDPSRKQTTIRGYHKYIRPYIVEAVLMRKIAENPYTHFLVQRGTYAQRNPLTEEELNTIYNARLPENFTKAQDIFIFQAYTGLSYTDAMDFDARENIVMRNGKSYISGFRNKTDIAYYTPILPRAEAVLLKYGDRLPRLSNQKYNMHLHAIEGILGLQKPITSHVARHTFATLMLTHDIPVPVVSRMLGHTDIGTTQIYAKITSEKIEKSAERLWEDLE